MMIHLPLESAKLPADAVEIARITGAWGVKGWFKVLIFNAQPDAIFACRTWYLEPAERGVKTFSHTLQMLVSDVKTHSEFVVAHADGVDDRNVAEALRGARIFVSRSSFPAAQPDEYYWVDLMGLTVWNREGINLGVVQDLLSTGLQSVLVITDEAGGSRVERMIPFVSAFVDDVSLERKIIKVDWQPDY